MSLGAVPSWSILDRPAKKFLSGYISGTGSRSGYGSSRGLYGDPPCVYPKGGFFADYR